MATTPGAATRHGAARKSAVFPQPGVFLAGTHPSAEAYQAMWDRARDDPLAFWAEHARELHWFQPYQQVLDWQEPFARWFVDGQTNVSYNCLDSPPRHRREKTRRRFSGKENPVTRRSLTYRELHHEVCRAANMLRSLGIGPGDVVSIYMPMVPELAIAMLACARIGAVHSVIFAGFSAEAIAERNNDAAAKLQITADGGWRRGKVLPLKETVDEALTEELHRGKVPRPAADRPGRADASRPRLLGGTTRWRRRPDECPATPLDSEAPLFILYTSGSTGKPKGIKHTTAGYNLYHQEDLRMGL